MVGLVGGPFGSVFGSAVSGAGEVGRSTGMAEVIVTGLVVTVETS